MVCMMYWYSLCYDCKRCLDVYMQDRDMIYTVYDYGRGGGRVWGYVRVRAWGTP